MDLISIFALALGLAMDAMAVSISAGITLGKPGIRPLFRLSFHFGLFQAGMPLLGWLAGAWLSGRISAWDHWIAFALLAAVGGKMVYESLSHDAGKRKEGRDPTRGVSLVVLSVATSIDAFAVGMSLAMLEASIWVPCLVIGTVTAALSAVGGAFGRLLGHRFGRGMELAGGLLLLGIGVKIVLEHGL